jgi:hypothetical protein
MLKVVKAALGLIGATLAAQPAWAVPVPLPPGDIVFTFVQTNNFGKPDVFSGGTLAVSAGSYATSGINVHQSSVPGVTLDLVGTGLDVIDFFAGRDGVTLAAQAESGVTPPPGAFGGDCAGLGFPICFWTVDVSIPAHGAPTGTLSFNDTQSDFVFNLFAAGEYSGEFRTDIPLPFGETCGTDVDGPECRFAGSVPEPASLGILGLAVSSLLLAGARRRS